MSRTKEELLAASVQVKTETVKGANTADRIGGILYDISEHIGEGSGNPFPTPTGAGYLHFNGANYLWDTPSGGGGATTLGGLNDVTISSPSEGQVLKYSGGQWINGSGGGSGSGIDWSDLTNHGKWWNQSLTKSGDNYLVKGPLAGEISYIEFSNGVRLGVDNENASTLKVYNNGSAQANFYATGGVSALGYDASGGGGGGGLTPGNWAEYFNGKPTNGLDITNGYLGKTGNTISWISGSPSGGLNSPLQEINNSNLGTHDSTKGSKQILVWNSSGINPNGVWTFENMPEGGQGGSGTVTSVGVMENSGLTTSENGMAITTSGNIGVDSNHKIPTITEVNKIGEVDNKLDTSTFENTTWWGQQVNQSTNKVDGEISIHGTCKVSMADTNALEYDNTQLALGYGFKDTKPVSIFGNEVDFLPTGQNVAKVIYKNNNGTIIQGIQIGDGLLSWDSRNSAIRVSKINNSSEVAAHLYATGGVSALGIQPEMTGLESFTINNLNSSKISLGSNEVSKDSENENILNIKAHTEVSVKINGVENAKIGNGGIQSSKFYFDSSHYFYINGSGDLVYHNGSAGDKKVVLQDF